MKKIIISKDRLLGLDELNIKYEILVEDVESDIIILQLSYLDYLKAYEIGAL